MNGYRSQNRADADDHHQVEDVGAYGVADGQGVAAGDGSGDADCRLRQAGSHGYDSHADDKRRYLKMLGDTAAALDKSVSAFYQKRKTDDEQYHSEGYAL